MISSTTVLRYRTSSRDESRCSEWNTAEEERDGLFKLTIDRESGRGATETANKQGYKTDGSKAIRWHTIPHSP